MGTAGNELAKDKNKSHRMAATSEITPRIWCDAWETDTRILNVLKTWRAKL